MEHLSKSPVFPTEIIELIIDHLQDDILALSRISTTSHAILHSCRRHLFRSIKLGRFLAKEGFLVRMILFVRLFQYNPSIGQYVREVALHVDNSLLKWVPGEQNIDAEVIQTLTQTPFVEKLYIRGTASPTSWNSLHATLQQPILNCIHSALLTELSIYMFVIPITIFRSCVNLSALTITGVENSGTPVAEPIDWRAMMSPPCSPQPMTIPQLRSFEVGIFSSAFALALVHHRDSDGHPLIRFDRLKTLIVHCHYEMETQIIKDICKEAIGLETFACRGISFLSLATRWPDFSSFSTLKTWKGRCNQAGNAGTWLNSDDLLLGLCQKLQRFPQPNVLETLDIDILMAIIWRRKSISARNEWGQLDVVLSRGFPWLHTVSINVVFPCYWGNPDPESAEVREEVEMVRKRFPWLNENAAVKFDFSTSFESI